MLQISYNRKAIMATAARYWAMHKRNGFMGHNRTYAHALRRAWDAAHQEASEVRRGYNIGLTDYVSIVKSEV